MKTARAVLVRQKAVPHLGLTEVAVCTEFVYISADIDECKGPERACEGHACINTVGSYRCECETGYNFNSITRLCEGKIVLDGCGFLLN